VKLVREELLTTLEKEFRKPRTTTRQP